MTIRKLPDGEPAAGCTGGTLAAPPAGLPSRSPTRSYWLREPSPALLGHRGTPDLPPDADVVVVGSGITGAFAAWFLKRGVDGDDEDGNAGGEGTGGGDGHAGSAGRRRASSRAGAGAGERSGEEGAAGPEPEDLLDKEPAKKRRRREQRVVMLEAREACWGATGRNGGHCQPLVYGSAPAVAAFELEVFGFLERFVREEGVDCDWVSLTGVHAFLSKNMFQSAAAAVERLQQSHPELAVQLEVVRPTDSCTTTTADGRETLASLRVPSAEGAIIQKKAASLWPYRLVASVLERLVADFPAPAFNLQTNTPVTSLARDDAGAAWVLTTPRGSIRARQVLLATNGYTSRLLPAFADLIVPVRGQIGALIPPRPAGGGGATLAHSYVFAADPAPGTNPPAPRDDYLVQRPLPAGELIFGGGRRFARDLGVGEWRDDEVEESVAEYLRRNLSPPLDLGPEEKVKELEQVPELSGDARGAGGGGDESGDGGLKASFEWTGVMGYSRDHHAWVGPVPESLGGGGSGGGLYVCAGYTGHGMPAAALSAKEVVRQMLADGQGGAAERRTSLPEEFVLSEERVAQARGLPQVTQGWEATNFAGFITGANASAGEQSV